MPMAPGTTHVVNQDMAAQRCRTPPIDVTWQTLGAFTMDETARSV